MKPHEQSYDQEIDPDENTWLKDRRWAHKFVEERQECDGPAEEWKQQSKVDGVEARTLIANQQATAYPTKNPDRQIAPKLEPIARCRVILNGLHGEQRR